MTKAIGQTSDQHAVQSKQYVRPALVKGPVLSAVSAAVALSGSISLDNET
jgi:hypothetical protein